MTECPDIELWPQLAAGEVAERDAAGLRIHAHECAACGTRLAQSQALIAALARPALAADPRRVHALMRAVDAAPRRRLPVWAPVAVAAGLAAVAVPFLAGDRGELTSRGGNSLTWRQRAAAELRPLASPSKPVAAGAALSARAPLAVWYRNIEPSAALQLLAFVVDGEGEVHWVAPAWTGGAAPQAIALPRSEGAALMPESFVAEGAAPGDGLLVTVVSDSALALERLEQAAPAARRDPASLFPGALVWAT
ncbi:MAG: hypothetical protein JNK82_41370, partial [Myxococcaceae bacterium]|nr:hypothetical protein [Myxococcaceae bacterium]